MTAIQPTQLELEAPPEPGSCNDAGLVRATLARSIRESGKSRAQIADEMTRLAGRKVTERMLNGYTAESHDDYLFPIELMRAFCIATGDCTLLRRVAELYGLRVIDARDAELVELGRAFLQRSEAEEQIDELKRRLHGRAK